MDHNNHGAPGSLGHYYHGFLHHYPSPHQIVQGNALVGASESASHSTGTTSSGNANSNQQQRPLITPFAGVGGALTVAALIVQLSNVIISFFSDVLNKSILAEYSSEEVLGIMIMVLVLLVIGLDPVRNLVARTAWEGYGWRLALGMEIDVFARFVVLLVFGFVALYVGIIWSREGLTLSEQFATTFALSFFAMGMYAFYLMQYVEGYSQSSGRPESTNSAIVG